MKMDGTDYFFSLYEVLQISDQTELKIRLWLTFWMSVIFWNQYTVFAFLGLLLQLIIASIFMQPISSYNSMAIS